jgi:hypothetical protein
MKKKQAVIILCWILTALSVCNAKKHNGPRLEIKEAVFDFGERDQGTKVFHPFSFKNTGSKNLEIKEVRSTCGCTVGDVNKRILKPGDTASVLITFNTEGYRGKVKKKIKIFTNQKEDPEKTIEIKGVVLVDLSITPRRLYINIKYDDKARSVEIKNHSGRDIKLMNTVSERLEITVENPIRPEKPYLLRPGEFYKIFISAAPSLLSKEKSFSGNVRIFSDSKINPILTVPVNITVPENK